jgi:hypothetical protein
MRSFLRPAVAVAALALAVASVAPLVGPLAAAGAAGDGDPGSSPTGCPGVCRVLIISIPAVTWADIRAVHLPNLHRLFAESAIADLATRSVRQRTDPGDGYVALGAGARTIAAGEPGQNLQADEPFGDSTAGEVFTRRTGQPLTHGIGVLSMPAIVDANNALPYDGEAGTLGATLDAHGVARAVIANADEDEVEPVDMRYHREAALALMDQTGRVNRGRVDVGLLKRDPKAAFGLRLDRHAVEREFDQQWNASKRAVVLVEASDVARAASYRPMAVPQQRTRMQTAALRGTDQLVGKLLAQVDPKRDAVFVVGPYHSARRRELTLASLRAPGVVPGKLKSATTRRKGFVQIVDVAPTVLQELNIPRPEKMEGRPFKVKPDSSTYAARLKSLVKANRAAVFRDQNIGRATAWMIVVTLALATGAIIILRRGMARYWLALELIALGALGFLVGTFVAGVLPFYEWPAMYYPLFLVGFAVVYALGCHALGRRHPADALLWALGIMMTMHLLDALTGARLEFNTVFGYTATIGIRLAGLGNPGSAQLCASALLFAGLIAWRVPAPTGRRIAVVLLVVTVGIVGFPLFGQDFGGAISAAPAYLLLILLLYDKRITWKATALLGAVLVLVGLAVGFIDLARPPDNRTHVGRFFQKVGDQGFSGFTEVVGRKFGLMIDTFRNTSWVLLVLGVLIAIGYVVWRTDRLHVLARRVPTLRAMLISFAVLAVLATGLNDSGIQVMGMMLAVLVPTLVVLACRELAPDELATEAEAAPVVSPPAGESAPAPAPA